MIAWIAVALGSQELVDAARDNDLRDVEALVGDGADPNGAGVITKSWRGGFFGLGKRRTSTTHTSAVHEAVGVALKKGDTRVLAFLLGHGGDPNASTKSYAPPLHRVALDPDQRGATKTVKVLLEGGADATAVFRQRSAIARLPVDKEGNPTARRGTRFVQQLLDAGADAGQFLCDATTPDVVDTVMQAKPNLDSWCFGSPPLLRAVRLKNADLVVRLLDEGANPHALGMSDATPVAPLHVAAAADWSKGVELLVKGGADPNRNAGMLGGPPIALSASAAMVTTLVEVGANRRDAPKDHQLQAWSGEVKPEEYGDFIAAWTVHDALIPPEGLKPVLEGLSRNRIGTRVHMLGAGRFARLYGSVDTEIFRKAMQADVSRVCDVFRYQGIRDLKKQFGKPVSRSKQGVIHTLEFGGGVIAKAWRTPTRKGHIVKVERGCPKGAEALDGLPRSAVWLVLGPPSHPGPDRDRWDDLSVHYTDDVVSTWAMDWR